MTIPNLPLLDVISLAVFLICWLGYGRLANRLTRKRPNLVSAVRVYRQRWSERMGDRPQHQADALITANLLRGTLFFASTTVFILGGLIAFLGTLPRAMEVAAQLPLNGPVEAWFWETKALILACLYVYAFFKFTWSAWQYNVLSIVIGSAPDTEKDGSARAPFVETTTQIVAQAGESFNNGIRAYYFSIPLIAWFLHPGAFLAATIVVTYVLYRREFHSPMLRALLSNVERQDPTP